MTDRESTPSRHLASVIVLVLLLSCEGCGVTKPFRSSKRMDLAPFADHTIALAGEVQYDLGRLRPFHLLEYDRIPSLETYLALWRELRGTLSDIVQYSIDIVSISESNLSGPQRAAALADAVEALHDSARRSGDELLDPQLVSDALEDTRGRKSLLDGLAGVQPIVEEVTRLSDDTIEEIVRAQGIVGAAMERKIRERYAAVFENSRIVRAARADALHRLKLLRDYRQGDGTALAKLLEEDAVLRSAFRRSEDLSAESALEIEARLFQELASLRALKDDLEDDLAAYREERKELDDLIDESNRSIRRARVVFIVWSQTHRKLAAGVIDPAQVSLDEVMKKLISGALARI